MNSEQETLFKAFENDHFNENQIISSSSIEHQY